LPAQETPFYRHGVSDPPPVREVAARWSRAPEGHHVS